MNTARLSGVFTLAFLLLPSFTGAAQANEAGRALYVSVCSACHAPENVMVNSPKAGDSTEWEKRFSKGLETLTDNAFKGFGAMPPKGGASELSREQLRQAIQYMAAPTRQ